MLKASAGLADAFAERKACTRSGMRKTASSPKALNCGVAVVQALFGLALTLISLLFGDLQKRFGLTQIMANLFLC